MQEMELMTYFKETGAYLTGHFKLSSGLHSGSYLQCALLLANPLIAERVAKALAQKAGNTEPDIVIGPAMGGIVIAYELARILGARGFFAERDDEGRMVLRRGFVVAPPARVLIAEDVLTTGKSAKELIELLKKDGIRPVGVAAIVDRSGGKIDFGGIRRESLIKLNIPVFEEKDCPLCKEGIPIVKPGSRR